MTSRHTDSRLSRTKRALERNSFQVVMASARSDALQKVLALVPADAKVGVGGSMTIRELGLIEALTERGNKIVHHWLPDMSVKDWLPCMVEAHNSDVFLCSSNAVTEDGKLVNVNSTGNRVASMIFGPAEVIIVAGRNKIVRDMVEGL